MAFNKSNPYFINYTCFLFNACCTGLCQSLSMVIVFRFLHCWHISKVLWSLFQKLGFQFSSLDFDKKKSVGFSFWAYIYYSNTRWEWSHSSFSLPLKTKALIPKMPLWLGSNQFLHIGLDSEEFYHFSSADNLVWEIYRRMRQF